MRRGRKGEIDHTVQFPHSPAPPYLGPYVRHGPPRPWRGSWSPLLNSHVSPNCSSQQSTICKAEWGCSEICPSSLPTSHCLDQIDVGSPCLMASISPGAKEGGVFNLRKLLQVYPFAFLRQDSAIESKSGHLFKEIYFHWCFQDHACFFFFL